MASTGPGNVIARRVTDDLLAFSGETVVLKYMKFFLVQKTTVVIAELQAMEDQNKGHDSLLAAKDAKRGEESKLLALHEVIAEALEEIESQWHNVAMLDDVMKSLEYMREMVVRDSARVEILEQILAGTHVGMRLKAEYAADIRETV
nr:hypothetical protein [Tanacetum cinerariifolium]